jgi:hypothetical protein
MGKELAVGHEVDSPVPIEVTNGNALGAIQSATAPNRLQVSWSLKAPVAAAEQERDVAGPIVGHSQVENAVAIGIKRDEMNGGLSDWKIGSTGKSQPRATKIDGHTPVLCVSHGKVEEALVVPLLFRVS